MKIDRRGFLSLGIGAAAGTALSPIPWKLADDSSIWTQMWPWTPVPEEGEVTYEDSTCTLCPGGCGISVRKVGNRAVKIEGKEGHPINDGGLCLLGLSGLQLLYGPTRITAPLKQAGERGEGKWRRISWSEALSTVASRLEGIRKSGDAHMVGAVAGSASGITAHLLKRFLTAYGSPNFVSIPSMEDTYRQILHLMQGGTGSAGFDLEHSDCILSFGSGLLDGWGSPVRMFRANSAWRDRGAKVIQIEPRLSRTAAKSDRWVPIVPGTEGELAMGVAFALIRGSHYRKTFTDQYAAGFEDWTDEQGRSHKGFRRLVLENYPLERVEKKTGVSRDDIVVIAKEMADASGPIAICGSGKGLIPGSLSTFAAVHALNGLMGSINTAGGIWSVPGPDYIQWPHISGDSDADEPRADATGDRTYPHPAGPANRFFDAIADSDTYPMKALLISGANPCYTLPDPQKITAALEKVPMVISFSPYLDETALHADLVLPNHTYLERWEDVPVAAGIQKPVIGLTRPVVQPLYQTRHTGDVLIEVAKRMGGDLAAAFPWRSFESCLKQTLRSKWRTLLRKGYSEDSRFRPPEWSAGFDTPSGKFEFVPSNLPNASALKGGLYGPSASAEDDTDSSYPLMLIPYDSIRLAGGSIGAPPFAVKTVPNDVLRGDELFVEINPATAEALRLRDGKRATLSTPKGTATVRVRLFEGIRPNVVAIPRGLGHTAYGEFLADKGINVNGLIGPVEDPFTGLDAAWGISARLSRA